MRHRGCITDPLARQWWRDYQHVARSGLLLSFVEYIAARVAALQPPVTASDANEPWYSAQCGHQHPWGASCSVWVDT